MQGIGQQRTVGIGQQIARRVRDDVAAGGDGRPTGIGRGIQI
jgi:hypothetical protein